MKDIEYHYARAMFGQELYVEQVLGHYSLVFEQGRAIVRALVHFQSYVRLMSGFGPGKQSHILVVGIRRQNPDIGQMALFPQTESRFAGNANGRGVVRRRQTGK